jgi:hypothetical protein
VDFARLEIEPGADLKGLVGIFEPCVIARDGQRPIESDGEREQERQRGPGATLVTSMVLMFDWTASLLSGYKSNRFNWLAKSSKSFRESGG